MLPTDAAWTLAELDTPGELWRGEVTWWRRVEHEAAGLALDPQLGRAAVIGCTVLLGVDTWRTAAALAASARGADEVFEEIV